MSSPYTMYTTLFSPEMRPPGHSQHAGGGESSPLQTAASLVEMHSFHHAQSHPSDENTHFVNFIIPEVLCRWGRWVPPVASTGWGVVSTQVILYIATHNPVNGCSWNESTQQLCIYLMVAWPSTFYSSLFLKKPGTCTMENHIWLSTKLYYNMKSSIVVVGLHLCKFHWSCSNCMTTCCSLLVLSWEPDT